MTTIRRRDLLAVGLLATIPFSGLMAQQNTEQRDDRVNIAYWEQLKYPPLAFLGRVQGLVVIHATLDNKGSVIEANAIWGSKYLIPDCLANAKKWRFEPNSQKTVVIVYHFHFAEGACDPGTGYSSTFQLIPPNFASITGCPPFIEQ